ncbi:hypothetical protein [Nonomuraea zeae]|uniref:Uncharacterized protein n=1 Tax=Nonomuraea zeae TaxID=1642303 RepID=A0A5S4FCA3_9ACTN|nr:hypothetical protein [Nonomuraea zeae]TMR15747.1 hypothetical protein ETD85_55945 [Nonomuraea zeae]
MSSDRLAARATIAGHAAVGRSASAHWLQHRTGWKPDLDPSFDPGRTEVEPHGDWPGRLVLHTPSDRVHHDQRLFCGGHRCAQIAVEHEIEGAAGRVGGRLHRADDTRER